MAFVANQVESAIHMSTTPGRKKQTEKREEIEREVSSLRKMLEHEQKVNEILESVDNRQHGSALSIPKLLPPKMKELLVELAVVEGEILRLESQIRELHVDLDGEKRANRKSKSVRWQIGTPDNNSNNNYNNPRRSSSNNFTNSDHSGFGIEKPGFETKALHFISKAINGDYNLISVNDQKENQFMHEDIIGVQERFSRKSGILLKPSSPLRDPRNQTPKRDRNLEIQATAIHQSDEEIIQKMTPNKLSENIMKCLIFIFVRLLRSSRAMELEKTGPISRAANFSLSFRSAESSTNSSKTTNMVLQKESRQQDPYEIFNMEDSIPRDIGPYKNLVKFTSTSLDPKCVSNSSFAPLLHKLRILLNNLQKVDMRFLTNHQKLAFWINVYNACIMHGFLQYGVPSSPDKLLTLMNKATINVGGNTINAQAIELYILRKPTSLIIKEVSRQEANIPELHRLEAADPNVTFALCCGTRSSPAVKIYTGEGVLSELEKSKLEYLQASIVVTSTKRIGLPELLLRNMHEFAPNPDSLIRWLCHQLPTSGSLRKSIVDCFRALSTNAKVSTVIEKIPYEYDFQYLLPM